MSRRAKLPATPPQPPSWPADKIERRSVASLTPYANNARTHSAAQIKQIAASIQEWGWTIPILIDEQGGIIAGHGRVMAAEQLGIEEVPVMVARGWTEEQKRAYVIADNQIALNAGWDEPLLRLELGGLAKLDYDLSLVGFDDVRLATFIGGTTGEFDPDEDVEPEAVPITRAGDIWMLGKHRIICGDSTDKATVDRLLNGAKPHLMVTDPPYGVDYNPNWRNEANRWKGSNVKLGASAVGKVMNDGQSDWTEAWALFPGDVAYVWHAALHCASVAMSLLSAGFDLRSQIVWDKTRLVIGRGDYHWQHEPCWYAVKKGKTGRWSGDRKQTTVWSISKQQTSETGHGTQKPVECMKRPIENNSKPGDLIYEPFSGSGTTIIAAEMSNRACLAIELNPVYVDVAVRRWEKFTGNRATLQGSKRTFAQIEKERVSAA